MSDGYRDAFIENDNAVIGNSDVGTSLLGRMASRKARRKSRKSRKSSRSRKSRKRHKKVRRPRRKSRAASRRKGKGMSKEFLRNLRKKHGLGEFKKR